MDLDSLIEKTIAELNLVVYAEFNANASIFDAAGRKILRAAFAEVRREPEEKLRELREAVNRAVSALRDGIVRYELVRAMNAAALLPPAAEEKGREYKPECKRCEGSGFAPNCTAADRARGDMWECSACEGTGEEGGKR